MRERLLLQSNVAVQEDPDFNSAVLIRLESGAVVDAVSAQAQTNHSCFYC